MVTHMKTTIELPDQLLAAAKAAAIERRTTLKAMMEHALRREIAFDESAAADAAFENNKYGFPVLKRSGSSVVTSEQVYQMLAEEDA
jgi:Arc/MetJ family transcription regulator